MSEILKWQRFPKVIYQFLKVIYWFLKIIYRFLKVIYWFLKVILTRGRYRAARAAKNLVIFVSQSRGFCGATPPSLMVLFQNS